MPGDLVDGGGGALASSRQGPGVCTAPHGDVSSWEPPKDALLPSGLTWGQEVRVKRAVLGAPSRQEDGGACGPLPGSVVFSRKQRGRCREAVARTPGTLRWAAGSPGSGLPPPPTPQAQCPLTRAGGNPEIP